MKKNYFKLVVLLAFMLSIASLFGIIPPIFAYHSSVKLDGSNDILLSLNSTGKYLPGNENQKLPVVSIGDGAISKVWDDVNSYSITSFGESGTIASIYDQYFVYFLVKYDKNLDWVTIQWDSDKTVDPENFSDDEIKPLDEGDDIWITGKPSATSVNGDATSNGNSVTSIVEDQQNDLFWEKIEDSDDSGYIYWEIKRSLDTKDLEGKDIIFSKLHNVSVLFPSSLMFNPGDKLVVMKYVLSEKEVGSQIIPTQSPIVKNKRNVAVYMFTQLAFSIFIGSIFYGIAITISIRIISEEEEMERERQRRRAKRE